MSKESEVKTGYKILSFAGICGILVLLTFIILRQSPLHPWVNKDTMTDSSVFKTISMQMAHGYLPYRDSFDHKGPLLYLINFLGDRISSYRGVWVLEFIFIWSTLIIMFLMGRLYCDRIRALVATMACGGLLIAYFSGGNLCEEYAMPFIAMGAYVFANYFKCHETNKLALILCGASCGCVLMLRPNMVAVWVVGCIAVLVDLIRTKSIKKIWHFLLFFIIGLLAVMLPVVLWLGVNNALTPCIDDYLVFNFSYCSGKMAGKVEAFFFFLCHPITLISMACAIVLLIKGKNECRWLGFSMLLVSLLSVCTSGLYKGAENYGMVLVPVIILPIAMVLGLFKNQSSKAAYLALIFALGICTTGYIYWIDRTIESYQNSDNDMKSPAVYSVCKLIEECTKPEDRISVYGNNNIIYLMSNRLPATKYSFQLPIAIYKEGLFDEYYEQLRIERPKAIIITGEDDRMSTFLGDNAYYLYGVVEDGENYIHVYSRDD